MKRLWAIVWARCPRCMEGPIFAGWLQMYPSCPHCELSFEREDGFFTMSIYLAYAVDVVLLFPLLVWMVAADYSLNQVFLTMTVLLLLLSPWVFRLTRVLWLHWDQVMDPR